MQIHYQGHDDAEPNESHKHKHRHKTHRSINNKHPSPRRHIHWNRKRRNTAHIPIEQDIDYTWLYGWILLIATFVWFIVGLFAVGVSKLPMFESNLSLLQLIRDDEYYCYLIPMLAPVTIFFIFWNWFGMKFFRHN